jgi:CRISPR system Cascade subunit CasE
MYFSLILPEEGRERDAAHYAMSGPYADHQWLWRFFADQNGGSRDFLFRRSESNGVPRFYVVSKRLPQSQNTAWRVQTSDYTPLLEAGMRLRFDLRANPVVTRSQDGKSRRHDVVMEEKRRLLEERRLARWGDWHSPDKPPLYDMVRERCGEWLQSRAARLGFEIDGTALNIDGYQQHIERKGRLRFSTVDFSGELTVTDSDAFGEALRDGIGHAKAFGCGLLLVRRAI